MPSGKFLPIPVPVPVTKSMYSPSEGKLQYYPWKDQSQSNSILSSSLLMALAASSQPATATALAGSSPNSARGHPTHAAGPPHPNPSASPPPYPGSTRRRTPRLQAMPPFPGLHAPLRRHTRRYPPSSHSQSRRRATGWLNPSATSSQEPVRKPRSLGNRCPLGKALPRAGPPQRALAHHAGPPYARSLSTLGKSGGCLIYILHGWGRPERAQMNRVRRYLGGGQNLSGREGIHA